MIELVPQKRADKNGKLVTRHVKPQASTSARGPIAPPVLPGTSLESLKKELAEALLVPLSEFQDVHDQWRIEGMLSLAKEHDFTRIATYFTDTMASLTTQGSFSDAVGYFERNYEIACDIFASSPDRESFITYAPDLVASLVLYNIDMSHADERILMETTCRIWVHDAMLSGKFFAEVFPPRRESKDRLVGGTKLRDDLARYIIANPEKNDAIVNMITTRKVSSPKDIQEMLDSANAVSLSDGAL